MPSWLRQPNPLDRALDPPVDFAAEGPIELERSFAFIDLCGFTAYTQRSGPAASREVLLSFRSLVRAVVARRSMRVARWVGDGVLLVGLEPATAAAAAVDIVARVDESAFDVRAGVDVGPALLFDGDDYVGTPVNTSARLCDAAAAGEVLATTPALDHLPAWIACGESRVVEVRGLTGGTTVTPLGLVPEVSAPHWDLPGQS